MRLGLTPKRKAWTHVRSEYSSFTHLVFRPRQYRETRNRACRLEKVTDIANTSQFFSRNIMQKNTICQQNCLYAIRIPYTCAKSEHSVTLYSSKHCNSQVQSMATQASVTLRVTTKESVYSKFRENSPSLPGRVVAH